MVFVRLPPPTAGVNSFPDYVNRLHIYAYGEAPTAGFKTRLGLLLRLMGW